MIASNHDPKFHLNTSKKNKKTQVILAVVDVWNSGLLGCFYPKTCPVQTFLCPSTQAPSLWPRNRFHLFRQHDELLPVPGNIQAWNNVRRKVILMRVSCLDFLLMAEIQLTSWEWFPLSCGYQDFWASREDSYLPIAPPSTSKLDRLERDLKEAYGRNLQSLVDILLILMQSSG